MNALKQSPWVRLMPLFGFGAVVALALAGTMIWLVRNQEGELAQALGEGLAAGIPLLLVVFALVLVVLMIVASIPLGLGWLLLGPVLLASFYTGYRDVFHRA